MVRRASVHLTTSRARIDEAYAHARQAILQDRRYGAAYNTLGVIYERKGLRARAEQAFAAALSREDHDGQ